MFEHSFKRVQKGDRPNADEQNRLLSTVEALAHNDKPSGNFFGAKYDLNPKEHHILRGVLLQNLTISQSPLTSPSSAYMLVLKPIATVTVGEPASLGSAGYHVPFTNRSSDTAGRPGTFMKIEWTGEEWSLYWIDCDPSDEGLALAEAYEYSIGGLPDDGYNDSPYDSQVESRKCGGGGGAEIIYFRTLSFCYGLNLGQGCQCIESEVTRVLCSSSLLEGDAVTIWDPDRCNFNIPTDQLLNRIGRATLFRTGYDRGGAHCVQTTDPGDCMWIVDFLCCAEEEYAP